MESAFARNCPLARDFALKQAPVQSTKHELEETLRDRDPLTSAGNHSAMLTALRERQALAPRSTCLVSGLFRFGGGKFLYCAADAELEQGRATLLRYATHSLRSSKALSWRERPFLARQQG